MNRLVAVSNRVAGPQTRADAGGLATGLLAALQQGGDVWFGWNGDLSDGEHDEPRLQKRRGITFATIALDTRQFEQYYNGYCNNTLWPLLHYRVGFLEYDREQHETYIAVNSLFARKLAPLLQPHDLVWVHDFHLIPLGAQLRKIGITQPLGFFLHTPFPSFDVLRALPGHEQLLRDLCAYDLVGFQTRRDLNAFLNGVSQPEVGASVHPDRSVHYRDHTLFADVFPISVDVAVCESLAAANENSRQLERLRTSLQGRNLLIGVDRLDYSKGLPKRFQAFERLLTTHSRYRRKVVFMQIAPPTRVGVRAYTEIRHELEQAAGHINGKFAETDWMPLRYLNRSIERGTLMAMLRLARIGLVTPIRDGMNLVAKEYVAAQDTADPGVLVLSTTAGAAEEFRHAVLVNPHDVRAVVEGIRTGLDMPLEERRARHAAMMQELLRNDIGDWRWRFTAALAEIDGRLKKGH